MSKCSVASRSFLGVFGASFKYPKIQGELTDGVVVSMPPNRFLQLVG